MEVAIAAVEAVFDWKNYLYETFGYEVDDSWLVDEDKTEESDDDQEELDDAQKEERAEDEEAKA